MQRGPSDRCKSCPDVQVIWATTESGKAMLVDLPCPARDAWRKPRGAS